MKVTREEKKGKGRRNRKYNKKTKKTKNIDLIELNMNTSKTKKKFKIVLIDCVDNLSYYAQASLRRTMEKYVNNVLFIFTSNSISNIPDSIKSRCLNIQCPILEKTELSKFTKVFLKDINIDSYTTSDINKLIKSCNSDFNKMLLKLDTDNYFTNLKNNKIDFNDNQNDNDSGIDKLEEQISNTISLDNDPIKYKDLLDSKIKKHLTFLKRTKNLLNVISKNREFIYNITYFNYSNQEILEKFLKIILSKYKDIKFDLIIKLTADTDMNIIKSNRDVFHYERYLLNIYKLFHKHNIN